MKFASSRVQLATVPIISILLGFRLIAGAQTMKPPEGAEHMPVVSQAVPDDPGRSLTAVVVKFAPGAKVARYNHPGIVFAHVIEGTVHSQLNGGEVIAYRAGQSGVEPPGSAHTLTLNPGRAQKARLLAVFVAPTGAPLTTYNK